MMTMVMVGLFFEAGLFPFKLYTILCGFGAKAYLLLNQDTSLAVHYPNKVLPSGSSSTSSTAQSSTAPVLANCVSYSGSV